MSSKNKPKGSSKPAVSSSKSTSGKSAPKNKASKRGGTAVKMASRKISSGTKKSTIGKSKKKPISKASQKPKQKNFISKVNAVARPNTNWEVITNIPEEK